MIKLGKRNELEVLREVDFGMYLDAGEVGDVLLPSRYIPKGTKIGDTVDVFLYLDNEERLVATTETPLVEVGQFAFLEVKWVNQYGAFLDWGLMKDLFCPFPEQKRRMEVGKSYLVYCYIDRVTYRIVASSKIDKFLSEETPPFKEGDAVEVITQARTDMGMKVIVENRYPGLIFNNDIFQPLDIGQRLKAFIKQIRPDGKIDLALQNLQGRELIANFSDELLDCMLQSPDGFCPLHDKSDPDDIYATFQVSKKTFKRAVGDLYKRQLITIEPNGLRLTPSARSRAIGD